ncbi:MAG TPA: transglycosylase domain-containing protein [Chthoniobacteraceae bacterium]|nr:transglycosylase domain-containing protein [Chthoniobacteraceae bacterium]
MWHEPPPSKPFYRRAWFRVLVGCAFLGVLAGVAGLLFLWVNFGSVANELDLSKLKEMESASIVYDRNEQILGRIYIQNRDTIGMDQIPDDLVQALVAAEDNRFFEHHGIDYLGILRAVTKDLAAGRIRQGASTVTQQLARNSFPEALPSSDRTFRRKLVEAFVARRIESNFSKQQILEFYFNRVYFGSGFYGVEAAAHGYFGKSAKDLTLSECATLTGMLKSPNNLSPWRNRRAAVGARDFVLGRMLELKLIDKARYDNAMAETLAVKNRRPVYSESYAIELVRQQVDQLIGENESVYGDGYRIYTSLDADLQATAEKSLNQRLEEVEQRKAFGKKRETFAQYQQIYRHRRDRAENDPLPGPKYLQGSLIAIDNATGGVLALVGGRSFAHSEYNRALFSNRPPGTAFLPLVYAAAFENGVFPGSLFADTVIDNRQVMIGGTTGILGEWGPERADNRYEGEISARYALVKSKNAATVRLGMTVGLEPVLSLARRARIDSELRNYPSTFLGSSEVTLEDLTLATSIFPNGGQRPGRTYLVEKVVQKDGTVIYEQPKLTPVPVIRPSSAYEVHTALADSLEWGTADKAFSRYGLKRYPLAGKTGTAYDFTDVWFVGYSSAITCGVWAGFDSPQPIYRGAFSNEITLPIWVDFMNASFKRYPAKPFHRPPDLKKYEICRVSGMPATPQCFESQQAANGEMIRHRTTYFEWGTPEQLPKQNCPIHGDGAAHFLTEFDRNAGDGPRAQLAVNLDNFTPVAMKAATVAGEDPYDSLTPARAAMAAAEPAEERPAKPAEPQVRRAEMVRTLDLPAEQETLELEPPPPIEF